MDLDVVRVRATLGALDPVLQAHQENSPVGAAVVHELDRLSPACVAEEHKGLVRFLSQAKGELGADPLVGAAGAAPLHHLARLRLEHLHVEAAALRLEVNGLACLGVAGGADDPPVREPVERRQRLVNPLGRGLNTYSMKDIRHHSLPLSARVGAPTSRARLDKHPSHPLWCSERSCSSRSPVCVSTSSVVSRPIGLKLRVTTVW